VDVTLKLKLIIEMYRFTFYYTWKLKITKRLNLTQGIELTLFHYLMYDYNKLAKIDMII